MPRGDGKGPRGQGPGTGRGMGLRKGGRGHGGGFGAGPDGSCICPNCGEKVPHQLGTPCYEQQCPKCGYRHDARIDLVVTTNSSSFLLSWSYNRFFSMYSHSRKNN